MAAPLVYIDGFDHQDMSRYPNYWGPPTFSAGRFGGYAVRCDTATRGLQIRLPSATSELSVGMSFYTVSISGTNNMVHILDTDGNSLLAAVTYSTSAWRTAYYANSTTTATTAWTISPVVGTWHTLEVVFAYSSTSSGSIKIYLDGAMVASRQGANNRSDVTGTPAGIELGGTSTAGVMFDDLWVESGSGAGTRGTRQVATILPTADVTTQWDTTTGANHYSVLADSSTSTYVATPTLTGEVDSFDFADLPGAITNVEGVCVSAVARKTDIGTAKLALQRGGTTGTAKSVTRIVGSTWQPVYETFETAGDATAWTPAKVNASTFGIVAAS